MFGSLVIISIILPIVKSEYPPFYAIKMRQGYDKFTIFEQDNCDQKLYQSRENVSTYLYPNGEDNSEWFISTDLVETMTIRKDCKIIDHGNKLYTFEDRNGTLIQKSGSKLKMIKLEDCKTYPRLSLSPSASAINFKLSEEAVFNYFGEGGVSNVKYETKETFFMIFSMNDKTYNFYDSQNVIYLKWNYTEVSKFMVFKAKCLNTLNEAPYFEGGKKTFFFPVDSEYEYYDEEIVGVDSERRIPPAQTPKVETNLYLTIGVSLASIIFILVLITVICVMRKMNVCCFKGISDNEVDTNTKSELQKIQRRPWAFDDNYDYDDPDQQRTVNLGNGVFKEYMNEGTYELKFTGRAKRIMEGQQDDYYQEDSEDNYYAENYSK